MRRIGVRSYLFIVLSLMSAAPVVWFGTVEAARLSRIATSDADRHMRELSADIARDAGAYVDRQVRALATLAAQTNPDALGDKLQLQRLLDGLYAQMEGYSMVYVADAGGLSLAATPVLGPDGTPNAGVNYSDRAYFDRVSRARDAVVSGVEMGRRIRQPSLHVVVPLQPRAGRFSGYVAGSIGLDAIRKIVAGCLAGTPGSAAVVVDESSRVIADSRTTPMDPLRDVSASRLLHWSSTLEPRVESDAAGVAMRASSIPLISDRVRWSVTVFRPEAQTQVAAGIMRRSTFVVSAWALLGALVVAYMSSRRIARPITGLVSIARRSDTASDSYARIESHWSDPRELIELAEAINQLLAREHQHKASLHELVRDRTAELEVANRQLAVLAVALENAGDAICMTDAEGCIEWTNPSFRRITGYFPGESTGKPLGDLLGITGPFFEFGRPSPVSAPYSPSERRAGATWRSPVRSRVRDGAILDLDLAISPVKDENGDPARYVTVARDVTAQLRAAQEVADSEARYRTLVEHAPEALVVLDTSLGHFVDSNVRAEQLFRRVRHHLLRTDIAGLSPPEQPDGRASSEILQAYVQAALRGDTPFFDWVFVDSYGATIPCEVRLVLLPGVTASLVRASIVDISERLQREQERNELRKRLDGAERLAGIGAVAAGVAHEINNPLAYILNNLDFVLRQEQAADISRAARDALVEAQNGAIRVRDIVRDLKTFARVENEVQTPLDVRAIMDSSINIASSDLFHRARIVKEYAEVPMVVADQSRLGQVFLNLIINALQALPEGSPAEQLIRIQVRPSEISGWIEVSVEDSGHGIPEDRLERIFEPFYTTKAIGKGTGLGLSISRNVVTSMGGRIEVESQVGKGSKFTVILAVQPLEAIATETTVEVASDAPLSTRSLNILVLDDDVMVARSIARILGAQHQVTICTRGSEALTMTTQNDYQLVFCDVMMPEMNGLEFHDKLRETRPTLAQRLVFMTGGLFIAEVRERLADLANPCIAKPFQPEAVLDAVRRSVRQAS